MGRVMKIDKVTVDMLFASLQLTQVLNQMLILSCSAG